MDIQALCVSAALGLFILSIGLFIITLNDRKNLLVKEEKTNSKAKYLKERLGKNLKYYILLGFSFVIFFGLMAYTFTNNIVITIISASLGLAGPILILRILENAEKKNFDERYARALRQLASALKSGLTIPQAIEETSNSPFIHESVRSLFEQMDADLKVGLSVEETFKRMAEKVDSEDANDVAAAISMQAEVGGSEAVVVETIANNISSRLAVKREIKSLFASTSITVWALDIIPFLILIYLMASSPQFVAPYFQDSTMTLILIAMIGLMLIGSFVMRKSIGGIKKI